MPGLEAAGRGRGRARRRWYNGAVPQVAFEIVASDPECEARAGILHTPHGPIPTPAFLPVGTLGAVRAATPGDLEAWGAPAFMTNAYHLAMRPGAATVAALGGLHALAGWQGPLMTDSGGYQVFSLAAGRTVGPDGVRVRSHVDGSVHHFTPESVMEAHRLLGGDLIMPLDVCTGPQASLEDAARDCDTTFSWARRSLAALRRSDQLLYGIVQGAADPSLRRDSARAIAALGFEAFAIGGVSVGEGKTKMRAAIEATVPHLPVQAPRHLLGVGEVDDLIHGIARGIDTFDCVVPTRWARHGAAVTTSGRMNVRNAVHAADPRPLVAGCTCPTCARFGRGAIRHYLLAGEIVALQLLTAHNVCWMLSLAREARQAIIAGQYAAFASRWRIRRDEETADLPEKPRDAGPLRNEPEHCPDRT